MTEHRLIRHRIIRRAPYNYEVIIADRWRIPYAPAYGWGEYVRGIYKAVVRTDPAYSHDAMREPPPSPMRESTVPPATGWVIPPANHHWDPGVPDPAHSTTDDDPTISDLRAGVDYWRRQFQHEHAIASDQATRIGQLEDERDRLRWIAYRCWGAWNDSALTDNPDHPAHPLTGLTSDDFTLLHDAIEWAVLHEDDRDG